MVEDFFLVCAFGPFCAFVGVIKFGDRPVAHDGVVFIGAEFGLVV